ncbi:HRDC domain-containing protein, partial [Clostridioides difficile]
MFKFLFLYSQSWYFKVYRHSIASEEMIAPYMVFGDGTLRAMSSSYPINK